MNKEFSVIDLDVHFYLNDEQKHQMDAIVLAKCQLQLFEALQHMAQYTGECIRIETCALEPGGVVSTLQVIFNKDTTTKIEEYYKKGDDESAILCGKLLAE